MGTDGKKICFEKMWLQHQDCEKVVQRGWLAGDFAAKARKYGETLSQWDRDEFGNISRKVKTLSGRLKILQTSAQTKYVLAEMKVVESELN